MAKRRLINAKSELVCAPAISSPRFAIRSTTSGCWYAPEFGEKGDCGVVNTDWGTSFVSAEWMLDNLTPKWEIVEYATGRNESNQDVYVLRSRTSTESVE